MVSGKGKEPHEGEQPKAGLRDIKEDIAKGLDETLPALKRFFQTLNAQVWSYDSTINLIKTAKKSDGPERQWLIITNHLVEELNRRYDNLVQESDNQTTALSDKLADAQAVAESFRELALANASNSNSRAAADRDGAMPHPALFSGNETNSTKRTQAFRT